MRPVGSHQSPLYVVPVLQAAEAPGWLSITLAPGKKTRGTHVDWQRDLDTDLDRLRELGTTTLVPLLPDHELSWLGIAPLEAEARARGLDVIRFPFEDDGVPEDPEAAAALFDVLCERVLAGERLVVHCNGGLGRAGIVAACTRLRLGLDADAPAAIASVRRLRSPRAVENDRQEAFIAAYDRWRRRHPPAAAAGVREPDDELAVRLGAPGAPGAPT